MENNSNKTWVKAEVRPSMRDNGDFGRVLQKHQIWEVGIFLTIGFFFLIWAVATPSREVKYFLLAPAFVGIFGGLYRIVRKRKYPITVEFTLRECREFLAECWRVLPRWAFLTALKNLYMILAGASLLVAAFIPIMQTYAYLYVGRWPPMSILDALTILWKPLQENSWNIQTWIQHPEEWIGLHAILDWMPLTGAMLLIFCFAGIAFSITESKLEAQSS